MLDAGQYTKSEIKKYEAVYGYNFVSPGGLATAQEFTALLALQAGMQVLDVGCGIGGGAFYMAEHDQVQVLGIDLSSNMLEIARERCRAAGLTDQVSFVHGDILEFSGTGSYDRIYSRDVFLHIHDKVRLFQQLRAHLKPGGILLFTDYCCGTEAKSPEFAAYIRQRHYALCTVAEYRQLLEAAGFDVVMAEDRTPHFIHILMQEVTSLPTDQFNPQTLAAIQQAWQDKIGRAQRGEQCWGLFMARAGGPRAWSAQLGKARKSD